MGTARQRLASKRNRSQPSFGTGSGRLVTTMSTLSWPRRRAATKRALRDSGSAQWRSSTATATGPADCNRPKYSSSSRPAGKTALACRTPNCSRRLNETSEANSSASTVTTVKPGGKFCSAWRNNDVLPQPAPPSTQTTEGR